MALINCPECGNEVSDLAEACPKCGCQLSKEAVLSTEELNSAQEKSAASMIRTSKKRRVIFLLAVALVAIYFAFFHMSANERLALADCKQIRSMLKDPSSFVLADDIYLYEDDEAGTLLYIAYGYKNSYGSTCYDVSVFCEDEYEGDMGDSGTTDFLLVYSLPLSYTKFQADYTGDEPNFDRYATISGSKIARRMKIDFLDKKMIASLNFDI